MRISQCKRVFGTVCVALLACTVVATGAETQQNKGGPSGSITFGANYAGTHGDEDKFREDQWTYDGLQMGLENFKAELLRGGWTIETSGRFMQPGDYKGLVKMTKQGLGFVKFDYEEFDTYDDSSNKFYSFAPRVYDHGEDLVTTWRDANLTFGWRPQNSPDVTVKIQRWEKFGGRSILHGGEVSDGTTLNRYPLYEDLDEGRNRVSVAVSDTIGNFNVRLKQTLQEMDGHNEYTNFIFSGGSLDEFQRIDYRPDHETMLTEFNLHGDLIQDLLNLEMSASYSDLETDTTYDENAFSPSGAPTATPFTSYNFLDNDHSGDGQNLNWNTRLTFTPTDVWTIFAGLGYGDEFNDHHSVKNIDTPHSSGAPPDGILSQRWIYDTDFERDTWKYNGGVQVEPLSWVTGRLEGKMENGDVTYDWSGSDSGPSAGGDRLRWLSDARFERTEITPSLTVKPHEDVKLSGRYKRSTVDNDYDDEIDISTRDNGYPGWIDDNDRDVGEWSGIIEYRPFSSIWTTYKLKSRRQDFIRQDQVDEKIGESDSLINSLTINYMPVSGLTLSGFGMHRRYEVKTEARNAPSFYAEVYDGDSNTVGINGTYKLSKGSRISAGFSRTFARVEKERDYDFGDVSLGFSHRLSKVWSVTTRYRYSYFDEANNGNIDDYFANFISVGLRGRF